MFMMSCSLFQKEEEPTKVVADWGVGDSFERTTEVEHVNKVYHVTYMAEPTDSSYWYVILDEKKKEGGSTTWHGTVELATPYFDFAEAYRQFGKLEEGSKGWFKVIEPISKESVKTFDEYNNIIYNKSN
jgi:hypothetical protein